MKYNELLRLARKQGWSLKRQAKGSHAIYEKNGIKVVIPQHRAKEIPKGLEKKEVGTLISLICKKTIMKTIKIIIERASDGTYGAYSDNVEGIYGVGDTLEEVRQSVNDAIESILLYFDDALEYYDKIITRASLSRLTGINEKQLGHYIQGKHKLRKEKKEIIKNSLHKLGRELLSIFYKQDIAKASFGYKILQAYSLELAYQRLEKSRLFLQVLSKLFYLIFFYIQKSINFGRIETTTFNLSKK